MKIVLIAVGIIVILLSVLFNDEISESVSVRKYDRERLKRQIEDELEKQRKRELKNQFKPGDLIKRKEDGRYFKVTTYEEYRRHYNYVSNESLDIIYCNYGSDWSYFTEIKVSEVRKLTKIEEFLFLNGGKM